MLVACLFALAGCGAGGRRTVDLRGAPVRRGAVLLSVPQGFERYDIRGGLYRTGTRPPVIGLLISDQSLQAGPKSAFWKWSDFESPPANGVALQVEPWDPIGVVTNPETLHLPLSLNQPSWFIEHTRQGTAGYRWGYFTVKGQLYTVFFWSGREAPPYDRAAIVDALASIREA
jgi:hypothetical protein